MPEPIDFHLQSAPLDDPYELRGVTPDVLEDWDRYVIVDEIHDGARVPASIKALYQDDGAFRPEVEAAFIRERDWGASAVAERLAFHLGLRGYQHVQAARVACDYNRFRGWSVPEAGHLGRRALFPPRE